MDVRHIKVGDYEILLELKILVSNYYINKENLSWTAFLTYFCLSRHILVYTVHNLTQQRDQYQSRFLIAFV
jgi:hypothetical protein